MHSERGMKFDLAISSTAAENRLAISHTSVARIDFCWRFLWFCRTDLALQMQGKTNVIGKVFNTIYALVWWPCEGCIVVFEGLCSGHFGGRRLKAYWQRNIERSALKLQQQHGNKHRNKVCKFKLHYPHEFKFCGRLKSPIHFLISLWHMTPWSLGHLWLSKVNVGWESMHIIFFILWKAINNNAT